MALSQLQADFASYLQGHAFDTTQHPVSGPFAAEQLLQLYRNNFQISLRQYLSACFPVTCALVGEEFFAHLSKGFIKQQPLLQAELEHYGETLPAYIDTLTEAASLPYLADIAKLEWLLSAASNQGSVHAFPHDSFQRLTATEQAQAVFHLAQTSHYLESDYPILSIWHGVQSGELDDIDMGAAESLLIFTETPGQANAVRLNADEQALITAIQTGTPASELPLMIDDCLNQPLQNSLSQWLRLGIINSFTINKCIINKHTINKCTALSGESR